jgi:uncharacterized protein DUF5658
MAIARCDGEKDSVMARIACVWIFVCGVAAGPAAAQENADPQRGSEPVEARLAADTAPAPPPIAIASSAPRRSAALVPLYVSFATLQGMDYVSTTRALSSGAGREANPLMQAVVGNRAVFLAVKGGTTAGTIWVAERLWRRHPRAAVILMTATNAVIASVVRHNLSVNSSF